MDQEVVMTDMDVKIVDGVPCIRLSDVASILVLVDRDDMAKALLDLDKRLRRGQR